MTEFEIVYEDTFQWPPGMFCAYAPGLTLKQLQALVVNDPDWKEAVGDSFVKFVPLTQKRRVMHESRAKSHPNGLSIFWDTRKR